MRINYIISKPIRFILKSFLISLLLLQLNCKFSTALEMNQSNNEIVIEELRLNVPNQYKDIWLKLEKEIWEPWLSKKNGFLGRQIFYNKVKGEALLLVTWQNKKLWKDISLEEVEKIQRDFDEKVMNLFGLKSNPIKLVFEGELERNK